MVSSNRGVFCHALASPSRQPRARGSRARAQPPPDAHIEVEMADSAPQVPSRRNHLEAHHLCRGPLVEEPHDGGGVGGIQDVVVGDNRDDVAGGVGDAVIARRRDAAMRLVDVLDLPVARWHPLHHLARPIARAIVADNDLDLLAGVGLGQQRVETVLQQPFPIVRQDDDRDRLRAHALPARTATTRRTAACPRAAVRANRSRR